MIHNNRMATSDPLPSTREKANRETSARVAEEGIVLLENKGVLPFDSGVSTIALYGSGARHTIKGGTGSGDVNVRDYVTVEQGLLNSGYSVVTGEVLAEYDGILQNARLIYDASVRERAKAGAFAGLIAMMSNPFIPPVFPGLTEEVLCRHPADAAVYVLSRNSGEGADRRAVPGDYYLSEQEISDITLLAGQYQKFVLQLDPGAFDTIKHDYTKQPADDFGALTETELATLCIGAARIDMSAVTVVGTFSQGLPGAAGETTFSLADKGVPAVTMVDGPAGVRVNPILHEKNGGYLSDPREDPIFSKLITADTAPVDLSGSVTRYQYCTALPVASMLAQSWNPELLYQAGELIAAEMELLGVDIWLAPAMNIQRNPLCGRNFEYFSEDPLLTGVCAAALTNGVQSRPGKCVSIKHFAANNQETNRNFHNVHVSERALREIYLRGYEICLKKSKPATVMTALNLINGVHAACDHDLLTDILRREWGFDGIVMTDWGTTGVPGSNQGQKYDCCYASDCIRAGNDLIMPGSKRDLDYLLADLENGKLDPEDVRRCGGNILKLLREIESEGRNGTVCTENQRPE